MNDSNALITAADELRCRLRGLRFPEPVAFTYNPLEYAWDRHCDYLRRYGNGPKKVLFLGMNPGPYGMAQTGVPFGEIAHVRDWLGISGPVGKPEPEHPKRPVEGMDCPRREVSGSRLWGLMRDRFGTPEAFFARHAVLPYCPAMWMKDSGANVPPNVLRAADRRPLEAVCDRYLAEVVDVLRPRHLVAIGVYAEEALHRASPGAEVVRILHPSPASPAANRDWAGSVVRTLENAGIWD